MENKLLLEEIKKQLEIKHWLEDKYECKIKVKGREDD